MASLLGTKQANYSTILGFGDNESAIVPFETVMKDGYQLVDCVQDKMMTTADKHGDGKWEYKNHAGVSVIFYDRIVTDPEEKKAMTPEVCYNFCRTIPDAGFFGLAAGRKCYCAPYYEMEASDSSQCDSVCEGEPTSMCGGMKKQSIYSMHLCDNTREYLQGVINKSDVLEDTLDYYLDHLESNHRDMQDYAALWQPIFGKAGDPDASDLMQQAKVFAGELRTKATMMEDNIEDPTDDIEDDAEDFLDNTQDLRAYQNVKKADDFEKALKDMWPKLDPAIVETKKLKEAAFPNYGASEAETQYYPAMYFVDKNFVDVPSTCSGKLVGLPLVYLNISQCAMACDAALHSCTAFSLFATTNPLNSLCFLFSELESAQYYTGCPAPQMFLQNPRNLPPYHGTKKVACMAKLSKYEGTSIKPDPSGKCKGCQKKATKADRCFEWPAGQQPDIDDELKGCGGPPNDC